MAHVSKSLMLGEGYIILFLSEIVREVLRPFTGVSDLQGS